jgi:hypothetical protein
MQTENFLLYSIRLEKYSMWLLHKANTVLTGTDKNIQTH